MMHGSRTASGSPLGLALALALGAAACGGASPDPAAEIVVDTLPNGAVHVKSPATGIWREGEGWRLVEEVRIGAMDGDGPEVFGNVIGVQLDDEGRIFVADGQAGDVRVFSRDGRHLHTFGRPGGGPGEFGRIAGIDLDAVGRLWVLDSGNSRYSVHEPDGTLVTSHRREIPFVMMPWPGGVDRYGRLYDLTIRMEAGDFAGARRMVLRYPAEVSAEPDSLALPVFEASSFTLTDDAGLRRVSAGVPFAPGQVWSLDREGRLWIGTSDRYRIQLTSFGGDTLRILEREHTPAQVTRAERQEAIEGLSWFVEQGGRVDPARIPETKPAFSTFFTDEEGHLWVAAARAAGQGRGFDVFDPAGRYLGVVEGAASEEMITMPSPVVRGSTMVAIVRDELDVPHVVVYRIEGRDGG